MSTFTPNYNLEKPDSSDPFGSFRELFNDNMDIIDTISGGGGGSSNVAWNQLQVSGDKIAEITISHHKTNVFAPSHSLSVSRHLVTGTKIASLDYDGMATDIYAPTQPTKTSDLTNDSGFLTSSDVSTVAMSGDYDDLLNKPSIPTKTSDLNNDSGFITSSDISVTQIQQSGTKIATIDVDGTSTDIYAPNGQGGSSVSWNQLQVTGDKIATITVSGISQDVFTPSHSLSVSRHLITGTKIATLDFDGVSNDLYAPTQPTKTSDLTNDSGFITSSALPTNLSDLNNDEGFTSTAWNQTLQSGTKIAEVTIDGTTQDVYAPTSSGGSSVAWNQLQVTGDKIAEITISGHKTDVFSHSIAVSRFQLTGTHIADIIIDGVRNPLYAEQGGGSFSALIIITDDTGNTITATKDGDSYTATETSTGHYEVTVDSLGTWTISNGTDTGTVVVSAQTTYYFSFRPNGQTVTPTDDVTIWLQCGGRSENYTTLAQVLADSSCLSALMADNNAVDYLVRSTTFATDITADSTAMSYIGLNNYCANTLLGDSDWREAICNSTYFESVLNVKVPTLTENTAEIISNGSQSSRPQYRAFDNNSSTFWESAVGKGDRYIGYDFTNPFKLYKVNVRATPPNNNIIIKGSNDGTNWDSLLTIPKGDVDRNSDHFFLITPTGNYSQYIMSSYVPSSSGYYYSWSGYTLQFYGREDV